MVEVVGLQGAFVHVLVFEQVETLQAADLQKQNVQVRAFGDVVNKLQSRMHNTHAIRLTNLTLFRGGCEQHATTKR